LLTNIAFIGLGNMGGPMAANLVKAGHHVVGYDLSQASRATAAATGVSIAASALEAATGADVLITMLPAGHHVLAVWTEVLPALATGALAIDCSTIDVESARGAHALAVAQGYESVDAPVSGGTVGATAATLTLMTGASAAAFARAEPILGQMGRKVVHCGDAGAGQAAKICNNMILGISMLAISEAFVLADGLGLSRQALFDVASTSSGSCWALLNHCPVPGPVPGSAANRDYQPGFATELMLKDLRLSQQAALAVGAATPLGAEATALYGLLKAAGRGASDYSAIITLLQGKSSS